MILARFRSRLGLLERISQLPYGTLFLVWMGINLAFGLAYFLLSTFLPAHGASGLPAMPPLSRFLNAVYFSVITGTSTGYGDITPLGFSKTLAASQCIMAVIVFAVFVTKLVSRRQDAALQDVHRLAFEGIFYNIRHGLFIVRKDFDRMIQHAEEGVAPTLRDWETVSSAYLQAQSLVEEIPDFYRTDSGQYVIDRKREELLVDSMQRTLHRMNALLDAFDTAGIAWKGHGESLTQLRSLLSIIRTVLRVWERGSPHRSIQQFPDAGILAERLERRLQQDA